MSSPDPKVVVAHQLRFAKASITRARQDKAVSSDVQSVLLSLHTAVEALAKLQGIDSEVAPWTPYVAPQGVPRDPDDFNPATAQF